MLMVRPVLSLVLAVWFLQLAGGLLSVVTPVGLAELGAASDAVGLIAALHAAGFMAGAISTGARVARSTVDARSSASPRAILPMKSAAGRAPNCSTVV